VPKVGSPQQAEGAAPRIGDGAVRSRLYAGKPEYLRATRPRFCHTSFVDSMCDVGQ
jgi:hypothetical protein